MSQSPPRIWLIGGTQESGEIARALAVAKLPCTVTVTAASAQTLYPQTPDLKVIVGAMEASQLDQFCSRENIVAIVDASHPYAVEVSRMAIACSGQKSIPYLRYERKSVNCCDSQAKIINIDRFESLVSRDYLLKQRVLLTVGYKVLPQFKSWQNRCTLFARVLPSIQSLQVALDAGFTPDRIIALRPPVSAQLETALWQQWGITLVVTKASGRQGGEDIKRAAARELGIPLIIVARPQITYPRQTSNLAEVLDFCRWH